MTEENDTWSQTSITVTPEDDGTLREIGNAAVLSAQPSLPLDTEDVVYRQPLVSEQFLANEQLEEENTEDTENETYSPDVPNVEVSASMNTVTIPIPKNSDKPWTVLLFFYETPENLVIDNLRTDVINEKLKRFVTKVMKDPNTEFEVTEILNCVLARVFRIFDPTNLTEISVDKEETQTIIRFNYRTNLSTSDNETQTDLTCEPKKSNTMLLLDYMETKNVIRSWLEDCFIKGIEHRIIVDAIIDTIIDKCAERVRNPTRDQITQTVASYISPNAKEDDVLRKLKLRKVIDPFEGSTVVAPLMDDLLQIVCDEVRKNAPCIVKNILNGILHRTLTIIVKLAEIENESKPKSMEHLFEQRKKKILELMSKKETGTISTQTAIAGVPEIVQIKEPRNVVCSVCTQLSTCPCCSNRKREASPPESVKLLRTEDILLSYKPCYVVATPSERKKNPHLQSACLPDKGEVYQSPGQKGLPPAPSSYTSEESSDGSSNTVNVLLQPAQTMNTRDSVSGWSCIIDNALTKPWSIKGSTSCTSKATVRSSEKSNLKSVSKSSCTFNNDFAPETVRALEILKNTFCTEETCSALKGDCSFDKNENQCVRSIGDKSLTKSTSYTMNKMLTKRISYVQQGSKKHTDNQCTNSRGGFKIVPLCCLDNSDS